MNALVYAVRCNFARPDLEAAWNRWYSGPKLDEMLAKPLFLSVQRFAATALDQSRRYLALWLVASPDAFRTPEYLADWGFSEWTPHIGDWSRDLYRSPLEADDPLFDIGDGEALHVAAFDGVSEAAARAALPSVRGRLPGMVWCEIAGLDRHAPILGLAKIRASDAPVSLPAADGLRQTVFTPITKRHLARPKTRI